MKTNTQKTFLNVTSYAGIDWHDSCTSAYTISDQPDLSIKDPVEGIILEILRAVSSPARHSACPDEQFIRDTLRNIIENKTDDVLRIPLTLEVDGKPESCEVDDDGICANMLTFSYDKVYDSFIAESSWNFGCFCDKTNYMIETFDSDDVCYIPIRRAHAWTKPIRDIDIVLSEATDDVNTAMETLTLEHKKNISHTYWNYAEIEDELRILPVSKSKLESDDWYKETMKILKSDADELLKSYQIEMDEYNKTTRKECRITNLESYIRCYHCNAYAKLFPSARELTWTCGKPKIEMLKSDGTRISLD